MDIEQQVKLDLESFEDDDKYYGDKKYVTNSMLGKFKKSPKHLAHYLKYGSGSSPALEFGRAFHLCILEPEKYEQQVAIYKGRRQGEAWKQFQEENRGSIILNLKESDSLRYMRDSIIKNELASELIANAKPEVPAIWQDEHTGVWCKGKADCVADDYLLDLKTTREPNLEQFRRSASKYSYDRQAAFYLDGFQKHDFWFICIEKEAPNNLVIASCSEEFINNGRDEYKYLLEDYKKRFLNQEGTSSPSYSYEIGML